MAMTMHYFHLNSAAAAVIIMNTLFYSGKMLKFWKKNMFSWMISCNYNNSVPCIIAQNKSVHKLVYCQAEWLICIRDI